MFKGILIILLLTSFALAEELIESESANKEVARKKSNKFYHHGLWHWWGFALFIFYWVKVKVIIAAFIIGTGVVWAWRSFWAWKSCPTISAPIISYDHGLHDHIDHIPFSPDSFHDHDHISFSHDSLHGHDHEPYGAWSFYSDVVAEPYGKLKIEHPQRKTGKGRQFDFTEEQISETVFTFLGVGSDACRKRFMCEVEFKSKRHPLTRMAFRIFGRGFFAQYIRNETDEAAPKSFQECEWAHPECTVIEENIKEEEPEENLNSQEVVTTSAAKPDKRKYKPRRKFPQPAGI